MTKKKKNAPTIKWTPLPKGKYTGMKMSLAKIEMDSGAKCELSICTMSGTLWMKCGSKYFSSTLNGLFDTFIAQEGVK